MTNGELVTAAALGIDCIVIRDRLFSDSARRSLRVHDRISVVLPTLPQLRAAAFLDAFRESWSRSPIMVARGQVMEWPAGRS